jgi:hypothetical protein
MLYGMSLAEQCCVGRLYELYELYSKRGEFMKVCRTSNFQTLSWKVGRLEDWQVKVEVKVRVRLRVETSAL